MAFADAIRTATYTREELADLLDELFDFSDFKDVFTSTSATITSTASASILDLNSTELSFVVPSGQEYLLEYSALINYSHSSASIGVNFFVDYNGADIIQQTVLSPTLGTGGNLFSHYTYNKRIATAGVHTYKIQWSSSSGTRYSLRRVCQLAVARVS